MLKANQHFKDWIDNASYEELLKRWRFSEAGDPIFTGEIGEYYKQVMNERRDQNHTTISKKIGWEKGPDWIDNE